jgi:vacuolar iron transporter family protein
MANFEQTADTPPDYESHIGDSRQYMRDIILGVNDGLVSTFLLVSAVVGGGLDATQVLLTGIAGALAGMISMSIGEFLATKAQDQVFDAEIALERVHLRDHRQHEKDQLADMLGNMGLEGDDLETVVDIINKSDEAMLNMHAALEFGVVDSERRSPLAAAVASGILFLIGALPSVIPFAIWESTTTALLVAAVLSGIGLFFVGAIKTLQTKKSWLISGLENLALGLAAGVLSFFVGKAFDTLISSE